MATRCQRLTPSLSFHHIRSFTSSTQPICIISLLLRVSQYLTAAHRMRTKPSHPSFTLVLSKSPGYPFPPSYRCATEEKPYVFSMFPLWHKQEPMVNYTIRPYESKLSFIVAAND